MDNHLGVKWKDRVRKRKRGRKNGKQSQVLVEVKLAMENSYSWIKKLVFVACFSFSQMILFRLTNLLTNTIYTISAFRFPAYWELGQKSRLGPVWHQLRVRHIFQSREISLHPHGHVGARPRVHLGTNNGKQLKQAFDQSSPLSFTQYCCQKLNMAEKALRCDSTRKSCKRQRGGKWNHWQWKKSSQKKQCVLLIKEKLLLLQHV